MISGLHHFDSWLSRSTWYTLHPDEEKLFYLDVKKNYCGKSRCIDPRAVREGLHFKQKSLNIG